MAKIILKSPYLKPRSKTHLANYVRYVATREGVVRPPATDGKLSATVLQNKTAEKLAKDYPDTKDLFEYQDYLKNPTRGNADEYILMVRESHPELLGTRENYVDYIATRPGAVQISAHGLFGDLGKSIVLEQVANEVANHSGNVWTHIISLRREDAERLGYNSVESWQELIRGQRNIFSRNMKIRPENFRWAAAFHDSDHHPHVHMLAWSTDPAEPWLTPEGISNIKKSLAHQIFKNDLLQVYKRQTEYRDDLRKDSRAIAAEAVNQISDGVYSNPKIEALLIKLSERLKRLNGKKVYGYLPPDVKDLVNHIVDEFSKDERIAQLYDLWYEEKFQTIRTYTDTMPKKLPLSQNNDFKPIRNAIITEALNLSLPIPLFCFSGKTAPDEIFSEGEFTESFEPITSSEKEYPKPLYTSNNNPASSTNSVTLSAIKLLGQIANIIQDRLADEFFRNKGMGKIDRKLLKQIGNKKESQGLKF